LPAILKAATPYGKWPKIEGGRYHCLMAAKLRTTCAHCQFICSPDKEKRKQRYKMLTESGVVVQNPDGPLEAVSPDEAEKRLANMGPEKRALYEDISNA